MKDLCPVCGTCISMKISSLHWTPKIYYSIVLCENLYANLYMNHLLCNLSFQEQQNKEKKCWQTCSDDHVGIHPFFTPHGWDNPTSLRAVCWFKIVRDNEFLKGTKNRFNNPLNNYAQSLLLNSE